MTPTLAIPGSAPRGPRARRGTAVATRPAPGSGSLAVRPGAGTVPVPFALVLVLLAPPLVALAALMPLLAAHGDPRSMLQAVVPAALSAIVPALRPGARAAIGGCGAVLATCVALAALGAAWTQLAVAVLPVG